jgi:hypothetical protein
MKWIEGYLERWDLLQLPTSTIPYLGDPVFIRLARRFRLPRRYGRLAA